MYCPNCGTENIEGAKFCRACGANVSLVPQALTGQLQQQSQTPDNTKGEKEEPVSIQHGFTTMFMGIAFFFVTAMAWRFAPAGKIWAFWMLIPAFMFFGKGIGSVLQAYREQPKTVPNIQTHSQPNPQLQPLFQSQPQRVSALPPRNTNEFIPTPLSVTENTTRHLNAEIPKKIYEEKD